MGIFDKMFGSGANNAQDANSQTRFEELKQKYQSVLRTIEQQQVQLQNLHVENNKLVIKGTASSEQAKNKIWDEIKLVNPKTSDLQKGDDGLLRLKSGGKAKTDDTVSVTSGMLESSNVNAAQSLISMIELQRLYEFQIKSISSTDQNEQSAERLISTP